MLLAILVIVVVLAVVAGVFVYACFSVSSSFFKPVLMRGPSEERKIVLTFDDGPAPPFTEKILDTLREKKVPATFFVCGKNVARYPETVRRIVHEGHQLGNHTYSHHLLFMRGPGKISDEIDRAQEEIEKASGVRPRVFRPPYGCRTIGLMQALRERGLKLVMWSATGYDWKLKTDEIVQSVMQGLKPGAVVLLHDGFGVAPPERIDRSNTQNALSEIIDKARASDFEFVPLSDFLTS